jgi:hypothetical protein
METTRGYIQTFDLTKESDCIAAIEDREQVSYDIWVHAYAQLIRTKAYLRLGGGFKIGAESLIYQNIIDSDGNILNYFDE